MTQGGPSLPVWAAPPSWRAIDFVSDLHLAPELPRTVAAFGDYLRNSKADAICMLGDVFEVWVGDDSRHQPFEHGLVEVLATASALRPMFFMAGNRDFLVGAELCTAAGLTALPDPTVLHAWGSRWLLCHGDAQCLSDSRYQTFRALVRSDEWQEQFLAKPLPERVAMARAMRRQSMLQHARDDETTGDLDSQSCRDLLLQADALTLLHGHTHRPAVHELGNGLTRHVLSDWDLDGTRAPRAEVIRLRSDGSLSRLSPAKACGR